MPFADDDWASDCNYKTSTSIDIVLFSVSSVSWCPKKKKIVACSSNEAEYQAIASPVAKVNWVMNVSTRPRTSFTIH